MLAECADAQWDIICFSETRAVDNDVILEGGHPLFSGRGDSLYAGAAILIHEKWESSIVHIKRVSDRMVLTDIRIGTCTYRFIAVYFPHAGYALEEFETCIDNLRTNVLMGQRLGMKCMVGGDFNIEMNRGWRRDRLREFLVETGLVAANDSSNLVPSETWTFRVVWAICELLTIVLYRIPWKCYRGVRLMGLIYDQIIGVYKLVSKYKHGNNFVRPSAKVLKLIGTNTMWF